MSSFFTYSFQIILIQIFFLVVYRMLFQKETFFVWNRWYLLGAVLFSIVIPLVSIPVLNESNQIILLNEIMLTNVNNTEIATSVKKQLDTNAIILYVYLMGVCFFMILFLLKLSKIWKLKKHATIQLFQSNKIYVLSNSNQAFTFLNFIFIGEDHLSCETIVNHELVHQSKLHSIDLLLLEVLKIIFWYNPILLLYQNKLAEVHEFEADAYIVKLDKVKYVETIINQIFQVQNVSFTNNFFNQSLIKKRIVMLQKSKSQKKALIKYVLIVPMLLLSVLFFSNCMEKEDTNAPIIYQQNAVEEKELPTENNEDVISFEQFENVDEMPRFKDCVDTAKEDAIACFNQQLNSHIKKNFAYPEQAAAENIQGRVAIQFIIDTEGNVTNVKAKGPQYAELLEEEAIRIIQALPQFVPATLNGKRVNVKYGLPITFKLM